MLRRGDVSIEPHDRILGTTPKASYQEITASQPVSASATFTLWTNGSGRV